MKTHYRINGMHCGGCVRKVTKHLESMPGVTAVTVTLPNNATLESTEAIPASALEVYLQSVGTYTVLEGRASFIERVSIFKPLAFMFALVILWTTVVSWGGHGYHEWMRHFMGGFFLLFGGLKVVNLQSFSLMFRGYDLVAQRFPWWGTVYPFVEVLLGVFYTLNIFFVPTNIVAAVVMAMGAVGIMQKLKSGAPQTCACLGGFFSVPLTWVTVAENLLMVGMALWMLVY